MNHLIVQSSLLFIMIFSSLYTDLRTRKIPNKITITFILLGIVFHVLNLGIEGLLLSLKGIVIGFLLLIIPFMVGGLGGGDVKLIMAIGAIMGINFVLSSVVFTALIGAIIALILTIYFKRFNKLAKVKNYLLATILLQRIEVIEEEEQPLYFPYGIAIAVGTIISYYVIYM